MHRESIIFHTLWEPAEPPIRVGCTDGRAGALGIVVLFRGLPVLNWDQAEVEGFTAALARVAFLALMAPLMLHEQ